ncbi:MAG: glycerol kinase GlpK [Spirochaetes bacterium]|jgi:glycerol kinase|nr:glycerol kinase GlpK [Spirochaetota bacterium]
MGKKYIISIDLGTTGNRVFCFDETGHPVSSAYREFTQHFPKPGWVEHDANEIWESICGLIPEAIKKGGLSPDDAVSIGITNQRETTVIWDKKTGKPVYNAIVWQCRRTTDICNKLKESAYETLFRNKTGLVIDAYFSGTKIKWILDNVKGARESAKKGALLFGTIDTWVLWKLTGGKSHATDYSNASRTMIFDIKEKKWSPELLEILDIPDVILPSAAESASNFGKTLNAPGLPDGIVIGGIAGDQQAAMVGQNCVFEGTSKNTYGTGCFMLMNNGSSLTISQNGLLTTLACDNRGGPAYALEGSVFIGGAVVQWLRDCMKFFRKSSESETMISNLNKKDEVVFVPAFVGLGAPYWKMDSRGAIFGLTRDTSIEQIVRAAVKSIALQSMDVFTAMQQDTGKALKELRVDGGATQNSFLMQYQADILGIPVLLPEITESTALGAAYLAGITAGIYKTIDEVARKNKITSRFDPVMNADERKSEIRLWKDAINRLLVKDTD